MVPHYCWTNYIKQFQSSPIINSYSAQNTLTFFFHSELRGHCLHNDRRLHQVKIVSLSGHLNILLKMNTQLLQILVASTCRTTQQDQLNQTSSLSSHLILRKNAPLLSIPRYELWYHTARQHGQHVIYIINSFHFIVRSPYSAQSSPLLQFCITCTWYHHNRIN